MTGGNEFQHMHSYSPVDQNGAPRPTARRVTSEYQSNITIPSRRDRLGIYLTSDPNRSKLRRRASRLWSWRLPEPHVCKRRPAGWNGARLSSFRPYRGKRASPMSRTLLAMPCWRKKLSATSRRGSPCSHGVLRWRLGTQDHDHRKAKPANRMTIWYRR